MMQATPHRGLIGAAALFTGALFVFGSALVGALDTGASPATGGQRLDRAPDAAAPADVPRETEDGAEAEPPSLPLHAVYVAVDNNPFSPERTRPATRYRLSGDVDPPPPPPPPARPPRPEFALFGTSVTAAGGNALVQTSDGTIRMMSIGESMQGYTLVAVNERGAVMSNGEDNMELRLPSPQQRVADAAEAGPRGRNTNARGREQQAAQQRANMQRMVEQLRQGGANPQMLQSLMRMLEQGGGIESVEPMGDGQLRIRMSDGRTVMTGVTSAAGAPARTIITERADTVLRMRMPPPPPPEKP